MAASSDQNGSGTDETSAELGRLAAEMLLKSPLLAMNPTLVAPTAAIAAAAIVGFGLSSQMAGAFWGALQGATDVANRFAAGQDEAATSEPHSQAPEAEVEPSKAPEPKPAVPAAKAAAEPAPVARRSKANGKAAKSDDLKQISGIGPKLEQMLNGLGVRSVAQITTWKDDDIKRIDAALGVEGRIVRDDWVGQAKKLAAKTATGR